MLKWKQDSLKRYHEERAESEKLGNRIAELETRDSEKDIAITELELRDIENNIAITELELELAVLGLQPASGQTGEQEGTRTDGSDGSQNNSQTKGE